MRRSIEKLGWAALAVTISAALSCRGAKTTDFVRLTDLLEKRHVIQSPLMGMEEIFAPVVQKVPADALQLLEMDGTSYWAFGSDAPAAWRWGKGVPSEMSLRHGAEEWAYSEKPEPARPGWRWRRGTQDIVFAGSGAGSVQGETGLRLEKGRALEALVYLPSGAALFEFETASGAPATFRPRLTVTVNGQSRGFVLGAAARVRFAEEIASMRTSVRIVLDSIPPGPGRAARPDSEFIIIKNPMVTTSSDLILISLPEGQASPRGVFEFGFVPEPVDVVLPLTGTIASGTRIARKVEIPADGTGTLSVSGSWLSGRGRLRLWVDGRDLGPNDIPQDGPVPLSIPLAASAGPHLLELALDPAPEESGSVDRGPAAFRLDAIAWHNPRRSLELPLYRLKNMPLQDAGTGANPWGIMKKVRSQKATWNALLAPSPSLFQFRLRLPDRPSLRVGYGLLEEAVRLPGDGATFEAVVESGGRSEVLMSVRLDPFHKPEDRGLFFKDIDLSGFSRRAVTLTLRTLASPPGETPRPEPGDARGDLCFWANPVVLARDTPDGANRQNVILISLDAVRADHLGCYGYRRDTTPVLDKLAEDSAVFLNTISAAPYTLPSHSTMLTGLFPTTHGALRVSDTLDPSIPTLADRLRGQGLITAGFTGGGLMRANFGFSHGFDEYHDQVGPPTTPDCVTPLMAEVSSWMDRSVGAGFFLFLHTYQAHDPYCPPDGTGSKFLDKDADWTCCRLPEIVGLAGVHRYRRLSEAKRRNIIALYDADIHFLDTALIGALRDELKRRSLYDRTLIIITSDHGEEFFDHVSLGHSTYLYNEILKVPLIVKFPGSLHRGRRIKPFVRVADITPTVMDLFGLKISAAGLDGTSLFPLLEDREKEPRLCLSYVPRGAFSQPWPSRLSLIRGRYKFILNGKFPEEAFSFFKPPPVEPPSVELYDLRTDPQERFNLADREPRIARQMLKEAQAYLQAAERRKGESQEVFMDKELRESLRALGYIR